MPNADLLCDVADLVTLARSPVQRDARGDLVLVFAPEMPGRFVKALAGLVGRAERARLRPRRRRGA